MSTMRAYDFAELVTRGVESDELDYKAAMNWNTMSRAAKGKIARHLTAFANVRGGHLVIGVQENSSGIPDRLTGVSEEEAASFDPTPVGNFLNAHIEPELDFTIDRPLVNGKRFVIFSVRPFSTLPHICSRGVENELREGVFYIRTTEASSRPARRALELQKLIRRCMRNEREQLGRVLRGILYETRSLPAGNLQDRFYDLAADAENFFRRRKNNNAGMVMLKFFLIPENILPTATAGMPDLLAAAAFLKNNALFFTSGEFAAGKRTANSYRMLAPDRPAMWQFFDDGMFISFSEIPQKNLTLENLCRFYAEAVTFVGELVSELCGGEEIFTLKAQISAASAPVLFCGKEKISAGNNNEISVEIIRSAADIASGRENHAVRLIRRIGENFKLPDRLLDHMEPAIKDFLERR